MPGALKRDQGLTPRAQRLGFFQAVKVEAVDPITLFIIEDEEAHFGLMKRTILKSMPEVTVHHFEDAGASLDHLHKLHPDIIITDYLMPGMTGLEFLEILEREEKDVPVIMITGQGDENIAVQAMKLGAWDYIVKSADFFTLLPSVIEKVVREARLKESLRESQKRFQDLAERTSDWIWETDPEAKIIYSNPVIEDIIGYHPDEVLGTNFYELFPEQDKEIQKSMVLETMEARERVVSIEHRLLHKDGHEVIVETNAVPFFSKNGELIGYRGVHRDISARKRAEQAIRESEEKFRRIFEESPIGIELYDSQDKLIDANPASLEIFGVTDISEIKGLNLFANPNLPEDAKAMLVKGETVKYEAAYDFEEVKRRNYYKTSKSGISHLDMLLTHLRIKGKDAFAGYLHLIRDITRRKKIEEHVRSLSQQLMKAEEMERQRLSCDLHDHLAQDLSTLKISIDTLFDDYPDAPKEPKRRLKELSKRVQGIIMSVRNLAYNISPASLSQLGLVPIVRQYCEEFSHHNGVMVDLLSAGMDAVRLDFDTEIGLFRVIQEALNNIKKHAEAERVTIRLIASFPKIILRIEDDGKGFDLESRLEEALNERRMGIRSMEERVALLNGTIKIQSRPMQGTKIVAEVPYKEKGLG